MSGDTLIAEASKLSAQERMRVAQALWQSAWDEQAIVPLTPEQRNELERRLMDLEARPDDGSSWEEVRARLVHKL
jgi:putative addiction module component (TIGR02574 family)